MARPKALVPALRYHISGQSICEIGGTTYYLGPADSPESIARYAVLIREYQANGLKVPPHITSQTLAGLAGPLLAPAKVDQSEEPILVSHVVEAFRAHVKVRYSHSKSELNRWVQVCKIVDEETGNLEADKFGPRILQKMRADWVKSGKSRVYCNRLTNAVIRLFKWAVAQELADITTYQRLKTVEPIRIGETDAKETEPVVPANLDHVRASAVHLPPQLKAIVRIQVATGARPSEILNMRPCEIDRTGPEWVYRPKMHKNAKRGKTRAIPLVGDAKEAVIDFLNRPSDAYCFSPKEAVKWNNTQKRAARKSKVQPSQIDRSRPDARKPKDRYDKYSYWHAIDSACKKAGVPRWHPYQLRHLAGTLVREALGAEAAQALLGHANLSMTQHYAKLSENKAIEAAKHAPKL